MIDRCRLRSAPYRQLYELVFIVEVRADVVRQCGLQRTASRSGGLAEIIKREHTSMAFSSSGARLSGLRHTDR